MGDLLSPKQRDVFDRLRRRIEQYRLLHGGRHNRFDSTISNRLDHQRQDSLRLHQKWLESKAKRAAKSSKTNKDTNTQPDQRNNPLTQQKKRKADVLGPTEASNNNSAPVDAYTFDETDEPPAIVGRSGLAESRENNNQLHSSVSVNIVQQINTQADPQTNQIKLTVSSTLQTGLSNGSPKGGQTQTLSHASTSVETRTNICKQEPVDDAQCPGSANSSQNSFPDPIGLEDVDEIKAILDTLEKEEGELPPDLMKELDLGFKEAFEDSDNSLSSNQDTKDQNLSHKSPMFNSGTSTKSSPGPSMFADPLYDNSQATPSLNNMGGQGAAAMANYHRPPTGGGAAPPPPILPVGDTGPAAETLKQMAAQHQTQHQNQEVGGYGGVKGLPYGTDYADYTRRIPPHAYAHYQNYPMSGTAQANMYPYNQQVPMNNQRGHMAMQPMTKDPSLSYGATKPLSHYPGQMGQTGPSSLQQLQNQVQSHFSQGQPNQNGSGPGALQITQSQQMQMNHGSQRMQMSQSQQMQIHNAPHISVAQQQTFSMSPGMGPQQGPPPGQYHMNNQMKMQMMRHEQQQQQHGPPPQQGPPPPHMQSYMNRPPPEYKVPPGSVNNNFNQNAMGANPLQTMQNMVNQTNQTGPAQNGMYPGGPPMKTEMPGGQGQIPPQTMGGNGCPTSATNMPGNRSSPLSGHNGANVRQSSPAGMPSYGPGPAQAGHAQMMQGQQMSMANGSATPGGMKPPTPTYTSAIMRNQRPPNVNVGPEGLNISQQRPHPGGEWPRTLTPGGAGGPGGGGPPTQGSPQQMGGPMGARPPSMGPNNSMMAYGGYQGQGAGAGAGRPMGGGHMNPGMPPNMRMQMSQQQGVMVSPSGQQPMARHMHPGGMAGHPPQAGGMMMQQQQGVQVTHHGNNMASMNMSQSMSTTVSTSQSHPQQQPPPQQQQQQPPPPPQQQQPQPPQQRHQPTPPQQQQQSSQQAQQQAPAPQQQQQQQPSTPQNQSNTQSPHGYPPQSSTQNSESEFPLDFLDNTQGNGSHDFFDSMVPNSNSSDLFDEFFCK